MSILDATSSDICIPNSPMICLIVGVVEDFVFNSPFQKIEPMVIEGAKAWFNMVHIKYNPQNTLSDNLASTEAIFKN